MIIHFRKVLLNQDIDHLWVFKESWQFGQVDVTHFVVFNQRNKQPERDDFWAVQKQGSYNKVHALNVVNLAVIVCKRCKHASQFYKPAPFKLRAEVNMFWKSPCQVTLNLSMTFFVQFFLQQLFIKTLKLRVLSLKAAHRSVISGFVFARKSSSVPLTGSSAKDVSVVLLGTCAVQLVTSHRAFNHAAPIDCVV